MHFADEEWGTSSWWYARAHEDLRVVRQLVVDQALGIAIDPARILTRILLAIDARRKASVLRLLERGVRRSRGLRP